MKKILLSIICFLTWTLSIQSQILYGTTLNGGSDGAGTINKFLPATNSLTVAWSFENLTHPASGFTRASDGKFYGLLSNGGTSSKSFIFSFDPTTSASAILTNFDSTNGIGPSGNLIQAIDGKFYGMTSGGGSNGHGVIFSFDPATSIFTKLFDFDNTNGASPIGSLVQANDGKLYGVTSEGGSLGLGVIFSFDPSSTTYTKLRDFDGSNGYGPTDGLVQANDGKLYGATNRGGSLDVGVIFSFEPSAQTYLKLLDFGNANGSSPTGSLMQAIDGKLYGMTSSGGMYVSGVIFSFDPILLTYAALGNFSDDGNNPSGSLLQGIDGKLYGTTRTGGVGDFGTVFSFDLSNFNLTKLKYFDNASGANPNSSLVQTIDGKLYGITLGGGNFGHGVVFSVDPSGSAYEKLQDFGKNESGSNVTAGLVLANNGKFYGVTNLGGSGGNGVIFSFDPASSAYIKLKDFDDVNDAGPNGSLMQAKDGKLYGTKQGGGSSGFGVIYSIDPSTSIYTKLMDFDGTHGGASGGLIQASDGKLYATGGGGSKNAGVIYSFDPSTSTYTMLRDFDNDLPDDGYSPSGNLVQATNGKLYGTANGGINNNGIIFSFDPANSTYAKQLDFGSAIDGIGQSGSLIQASDGKLYGMKTQGGSNGYGVIYSFDPLTSTFTKLKDFDAVNGGYPLGSLMQASDGKLYGMTYQYGSFGYGVIFSFDITSSTYTKLQDFDNANGANPYTASAFIEVRECTTNKTYYRDADGDGYGNINSKIIACTQPAGYVTDSTDCSDNNAAAHIPVTYYRDLDGDGYGNINWKITACTQPAGFVIDSTDCNDNFKDVHAPITCYRDVDGDGFGDPNRSILACQSRPPAGYVKNNFDCDDHKNAWRTCDESVTMCHNGRSECVSAKDILIKLWHGWTLGACADCNNMSSRTITGVSAKVKIYSDEQSTLPQYKLSNYPNPFARTSTIKYELPFDSKVSIKVYDLLGRSVATLVDENKKAGAYTVDFNGGHLNKGSLYYSIIATSKDSRFEQTKMMILQR